MVTEQLYVIEWTSAKRQGRSKTPLSKEFCDVMAASMNKRADDWTYSVVPYDQLKKEAIYG